jgi:RimJ/RimL family protein N-acetyltransferase
LQLETERLLLRRPTAADLESPPGWLSDPEVMRWLGGIDPPHEVVRRWLDDWERFPLAKWLLETAAGEVVGRVGFSFYDPVTWQRTPDGVPELGWTVAREHWGRGYATEAAHALRAWFAPPRLISLIAPGNGRSQAVARRLGAAPAETAELPDGPHVIWVHPSAKMPER